MVPEGKPILPGIGDKVAFLSALPGVEEVVETHLAYVFLTADHALKLKKPVCIGHSDCRTLASRERAVAKEIWLNRDLAAGIYLGRLPLCWTVSGLKIGGDGPVVDWLVQMKRLPRSALLDGMLRQGRFPAPEQVDALADRLIAFYRRGMKRKLPRHLHALHIERAFATNARHLRELASHLPHPAGLAVLGELAESLRMLRPEILSRGRGGMVVEGHGDLRPEHVCLIDPPVIFDRAEAALELRVVDIWEECMFLGAECALAGYTAQGGRLADALIAAGIDPPSPLLLIAYVQLRLLTRARLSLDHLRDRPPSCRQDWPRKAQHYLDAAAALGRMDRDAVARIGQDFPASE